MIEILDSNADAKSICNLLEAHDYQAYCVGGCVRDALMNIKPADIDITTSALPSVVTSLFSSFGYKVIETGLKHGTVTVIRNNKSYEITTMRTEDGYNDMRHPGRVEFIEDIERDLLRRDFTVNAMAYSFTSGALIDPYNGRIDLEKKLLRCVGDPIHRLEEDALRILRGIRFASRFGFSIDQDTERAMRQEQHRLHSLSSERVYSELKGILCGKYAGKTILSYAGIIAEIIPELRECTGFEQKSKYHCYDVLTHICKVIDNVPPLPHFRIAALFHDIAKPACYSLDDNNEGHFYGHAKISTDIADRVLSELNADKDTKNQVLFLVARHDTPIPEEEIALRKKLRKYGVEPLMDLVTLAKADCLGQHERVRFRLEKYSRIEKSIEKIINEKICFNRSDLAIDGRDLVEVGIHEGKAIGEILAFLLDNVIDEALENKKEVLIEAALEYYDLYVNNK